MKKLNPTYLEIYGEKCFSRKRFQMKFFPQKIVFFLRIKLSQFKLHFMMWSGCPSHPTKTFQDKHYNSKKNLFSSDQGDQKMRKNLPNFSKIAQKVAKSKKGQNIYNKAQFESPKHLNQTFFETFKTMFWNCLFR